MKQTEERNQLLAEATRLYNESRFDESLTKFSQGFALFSKEEQSSKEFADFCGNYGSALAESGNLKLAEKIFNSALLIYSCLNYRVDLARIHFNLGNVYSYMNSRQPCSDHYQKALEIYRTCGDSSGQGLCMLQLANLYASIGIYDLAREWLEKIDGMEESVKQDPEFRWSWRVQQSKIALQDGQSERALLLLEDALVCARQANIADHIEETESVIEQIRRSLGPTEDTLSKLEQAYQSSKDRHDRHLLTRTFELAQALAAKGESERASDLFDECLNLIDIGRGNLDGPERFNWMEQLSKISHKCCFNLFRQGRHELSLQASERGQGRVLLDLMFRHQIKLNGDRTIRAAGNGRIILEAPTWPEIRSALRTSDTYLFKILEIEESSLAWFVSPDGCVDSWEIPLAHAALERIIGLLLMPDAASSSQGKGKVQEVRAHRPATRVPWEKFKQALSELYEALFPASVRERLEKGKGRLLIVPHLSYYHVPWSALGSADGPSLGVNWQICLASSVGVFMQLDRRRDPEAWKGLAGFQMPAIAVGSCGPQKVTIPAYPSQGAPQVSLSFCDLPGTLEEVQRVSELLNGVMLVGPQAHPAAVRAVMTIAGVIHLATHGYWDMYFGDKSFVVLAPAPDLQPGTIFATGEPGTLFAYQLMEDNFKTRAELVTLSGCQTGLGSAHPDTYINLANSFLVAGARSVLVSLWPIRDDATVAFMEEFYMGLRDGLSPAEALQRTQEEMSKRILWNEGWNWSGFVLVGNSFHCFAPEPDAPKLPGPAFCAGDVLLFDGGSAGAIVPLQNFENERQTSNEAWFVRNGQIVKISKN